MNEDPTRLMDYGDEPPRRRRPPQHKPKGNLRLVVAIMGAVIFGLLIALLVSCGGGETKTVTETMEITREIPSKSSEEKESGEKEAEGEEGEGAEESAEEQELREIEEAEAAEAETGGIEETEPTQEELELREIEEAEAAEEPTLEEPEGGGVGTG